MFVGGLLVAHYGWRALFIVLGGISLTWMLPWLMWTRRHNADVVQSRRQQADTVASQGFADILRCHDFWGVTIGSSAYSYAYYFLLTWLPTYLVSERHLPMASMAILGSLPYWVAAAAALAAGSYSDRLIRHGASGTLVRKAAVSGGLLLSIVALPAAMAQDVGTSIALLCIAYVAFGIFGSTFWAISQTLAGAGAPAASSSPFWSPRSSPSSERRPTRTLSARSTPSTGLGKRAYFPRLPKREQPACRSVIGSIKTFHFSLLLQFDGV